MAIPPVVPNVPATVVKTERKSDAALDRRERPKMLFTFGILNGLILLASAGLLTYDFATTVFQDDPAAFNLLNVSAWGLGLLLLYAIPIALLVGFFRGNRLTWTIYRSFGGGLGLVGLLLICTITINQRWLEEGETIGNCATILLSLLLVTYFWLDTKAARNYFGIRSPEFGLRLNSNRQKAS